MLKLFLFVIALYTLACLFLYLKQRDILFYPMPENNHAHATAIWLDTAEARIKIWKFNEGKPAIIYFGGNAESIDQNIFSFKKMFADFTVYLVNYRGYAGSSGKPTEAALFEDAVAVYDYIAPNHDSVHVIGRSLGSGVACYLAENRDVDKVVLITPYDSIVNVAQAHYPVFPVRWLIKDRFDSLSRAHTLSNPILVLMAQYDEVIPMKHSKKLISALSNATVESHIIKDTQHNNILDHSESLNLLKQFIASNK